MATNPATSLEDLLKTLPDRARSKRKENLSFLKGLRRSNVKNLDHVVQQVHDDVFMQTDCLECANCCKTTGPLFTTRDIAKIANHLTIGQKKFVATYLRIDEDGDFVLKKVPCTFLAADNRCSIYDHRPQACREYPHTDRKKIYQIATITTNNTAICPAAYKIVERMKTLLPQ